MKIQTEATDYNKQAIDFAKKHNIKLSLIGEPEYKHHFEDDDTKRWVFKMKLQRGVHSCTFNFGQSLKAGAKVPTAYDVLACLTKNDPGTFEIFCSDFGYDIDSKKAERIYKAVIKEWEGVERVMGDIIEELQEIQ